MNRSSLASFALASLLGACATAPHGARPGEVEHVVLVWLKNPKDQATLDRMVEVARTFPDKIPGFVSFSVGAPLPSDRDVVDDSFTVALVLRFQDAAALRAYEVHPVHMQAVQDLLAPNAEKLVVYDVLAR